jgi:hypothetical protein
LDLPILEPFGYRICFQCALHDVGILDTDQCRVQQSFWVRIFCDNVNT